MAGAATGPSSSDPGQPRPPPDTHRAAVVERYAESADDFAGPGVVRLDEARPMSLVPGPRQVLVRVHASSVNQADVKFGNGTVAVVPGLMSPPYVAGMDFAGHVVAVGTECKRVRVGQAVYGDTSHKMHGAMAEYCVANEDTVAAKPPSLTFAEAASLPLSGLTSMTALLESTGGRVREGSRVLVLGGTSATGSLGIQIARALGASEVAATCSAANFDLVRGLGASRVVDYRTEKWWDVLAPAGEEDKFDVVYDCIGGPEPWPRAAGVLRGKDGRDGVFTTLLGDFDEKISLGLVFRLVGSVVNRKFWSVFGGPDYALVDTESNRVDLLDRLSGWVEEGKVRPVVDKVYPLAEAASAFRHVADGHAHGKIVVAVSDLAHARQ